MELKSFCFRCIEPYLTSGCLRAERLLCLGSQCNSNKILPILEMATVFILLQKKEWWGQTMGAGVNSLLFCFSIVCDKRNWFRGFAVFLYRRKKQGNTLPCSLGTEKSNLYVKMRIRKKRNRLEFENKDQSSFKEVLDKCDELRR